MKCHFVKETQGGYGDEISQHFRERNAHFKDNPRRAGKKIWEIDFFCDHGSLPSGNYREY
jgi:hypothetical protein